MHRHIENRMGTCLHKLQKMSAVGKKVKNIKQSLDRP